MEKKIDATTFRRQEAKCLKDFGDIKSSIILNAAILRKVNEQRLLEWHGLLYANPILNLLQSSKQEKHWRYLQY